MPEQASLFRCGVPLDSPLERHSLWDLALFTPDLVRSYLFIYFANLGTIQWDTTPEQASLLRHQGRRWGPACYRAHQAPPWLCPMFMLVGKWPALESLVATVL